MGKRKNSIPSGKGTKGASLDILSTVNRVPSSRTLKIGGSGELRSLAIGQKAVTSPVQFGSPASRGNSAPSSKRTKGGWTSLLGSLGS